MKKILLIISFFFLLLLLLKSCSHEKEGWVEQTDELKALQKKTEMQGYMTEDDFRAVQRIHDEQFNKLNRKNKNQSD